LEIGIGYEYEREDRMREMPMVGTDKTLKK
jgi:hypothetical protein